MPLRVWATDRFGFFSVYGFRFFPSRFNISPRQRRARMPRMGHSGRVRFAVRRAHCKSSGDSSIRCHALRRSLASAADESHPLRPSIGAPSFRKEAKRRSSSEVAERLPPFDRLAASCKRTVEKFTRHLKCRAVSALDASANRSLPKRILRSTDARKADAFLYYPAPADGDRFTIFSNRQRRDYASAISPKNPQEVMRIFRPPFLPVENRSLVTFFL